METRSAAEESHAPPRHPFSRSGLYGTKAGRLKIPFRNAGNLRIGPLASGVKQSSELVILLGDGSVNIRLNTCFLHAVRNTMDATMATTNNIMVIFMMVRASRLTLVEEAAPGLWFQPPRQMAALPANAPVN